MIRNDRQLSNTTQRRDEMLRAAQEFHGSDRQVYLDVVDELNSQIAEYLAVKSGQASIFRVNSIDDIPSALVKARIARGQTQSALAESLDVSEQMVQRDEAGAYEKASLARLADIADTLGYGLKGWFSPNEVHERVRTLSLSGVWTTVSERGLAAFSHEGTLEADAASTGETTVLLNVGSK